ncbi:hypothetical protein KBC75_04915 [Candidatus Shapirobacteria bacterium]|nr:hypothetical protein [Candidatus Shapirobacteria bacterium]
MNLSDQLIKINQLNETKGQELNVLNQLPEFRKLAKTEQNWEMMAQSFWQEHLAHQHLVMQELDPDNSHRLAMLSSAKSAHNLVVYHSLWNLSGASHRFLGRAYTFQNDHTHAKAEYEVAFEHLKHDNDPRYLEVTGFLCESLIRLDQVNEGLILAYQTFDSYDTDPQAITLKQVDEYKYNVWRTGIFPRLVFALNELKLDYDKAKVKQYLEKSEKLLTDQAKYAYRIDEIKKVIQLL